jgi:uncharacterized membrane protein YphA (DoxX/SURF4 family)
MKYLVTTCRILVGILFIISGLIKLNDPMGFSFKLEEYFSIGVLNLPALMPYALAISLFVVIAEVLLGVMLLLGFRRRFTVWSLLLMILFFTFLTFYSAYFNKVTDCGCFGDAIKLTPWESFTKDVILLLLILVLFFWQSHINPVLKPVPRMLTVLLVLFACMVFGNYVLNHLPLIDFRPYKIGAGIEEGMEMPEDAPRAIFEYTWMFNVNGEEQTFVTNGEYPSVDGEFIGVETKEIQEGYEPPIHDFTIEQEGTDYAHEFLQEERLVMVIAYDLGKSDTDAYPTLKKVTDEAMFHGYHVIGMSASDRNIDARVKVDNDFNFFFYFTDQTTLKTIVRSNPGVLVLNRGVITQKVHYNDLDTLQFP